MEILVKHQLQKEEVINRLKNLAEELKKKYGDQLKNYNEKWSDDKVDVDFKVMGFNISGVLKIFEDKVVMEGKVPMMLKAFEGQVRDQIYDVISDLLKK